MKHLIKEIQKKVTFPMYYLHRYALFAKVFWSYIPTQELLFIVLYLNRLLSKNI